MKPCFLLAIIVIAMAEKSNYIGRMTLIDQTPTQQVFVIPFSDESKVLNINHNHIELIALSDQASCEFIPPIVRQPNTPPVVYVVDWTDPPQVTCPIGAKLYRIREAGGAGLIIASRDTPTTINKCRMHKDSPFFLGFMDVSNHTVLKPRLQNQKTAFALLTIQLRDKDLDLVQIWTSSLNVQSYDIQLMFGQILRSNPSIQSKIDWQPRLATLGCTQGANNNICSQDGFVSSCACNGQFCSPQFHEKTSDNLVKEDIRQIFIFNKYRELYFDYLRLFKSNCLIDYRSNKYSADCSNSIMITLGIDSNAINTEIDSFLNQCSTDQSARDTQIYNRIADDKYAFNNYGRYPLLLFNRQILQFANKNQLQKQLCYHLELENCGTQTQNMSTASSDFGFGFFFLIVLGLATLAFVGVYIYRRKMKRDMNKEIKMQVSTAVDHYYALTSSTNKTASDLK